MIVVNKEYPTFATHLEIKAKFNKTKFINSSYLLTIKEKQKMKKILFSALMACFALTASAQISEGAPSAKKYTTGNRPMKGTFGLYVGAETDLFQDANAAAFGTFRPLPIVNLKYMATDNFELRVGLKFWKQRESLSFGNDAGDDQANPGTTLVEEKYTAKAVNADNQVRPGFAYHFTKSNLLDVYAGIEGIIGWRRAVANSWGKVDGNEVTFNQRNASIQFGAGAFIGLQAFIARLPLALGLEYGISTVWDGALKSHQYYKDANTEYTIYSQDDAEFNMLAGTALGVGGQRGDGTFDYMKARKGAWGSQIRLTLSYYFNR